MLARLEWLPFDLALIRAGIDRAVHAVAALSGRATLAVATGAALAAERIVLRGGPITTVPRGVAELAGVGRIDFALAERSIADDAATGHAAFGGAAVARPATDIVAAILSIRAAARAAG